MSLRVRDVCSADIADESPLFDETAFLKMRRVLGQRVVWAKRGAGGWGLGGVEEAPSRGYCEGETCRASRCVRHDRVAPPCQLWC
jgi:hypothetical protein